MSELTKEEIAKEKEQDRIAKLEAKINELETGDISKYMNTGAREKEFKFMYEDPEIGEAKKFIVMYCNLSHDANVEMQKFVWKEAKGDQYMYTYLVQVESMKRMFKSINGTKIQPITWNLFDGPFVETMRELMFGPNPMEASPMMNEVLKNLLGGSMQGTEPGTSTPDENSEGQK